MHSVASLEVTKVSILPKAYLVIRNKGFKLSEERTEIFPI